MFDFLKNYVEQARAFGETFAPGEEGQAMNTILTLVIAGVGLMIGIYIFSEIENTMNIQDNSYLDNIVSDIYGAFSMTPISL